MRSLLIQGQLTRRLPLVSARRVLMAKGETGENGGHYKKSLHILLFVSLYYQIQALVERHLEITSSGKNLAETDLFALYLLDS